MGYSGPETPVVKLNVTYKHLKAIGQRDSQYPDGINLSRGFLVGGPATGKFTFGDIEVFHALQGAVAVENVQDSVIKIGGDGGDRIVVRNAQAAVDLQDISNSKVEVSHLETSEGSGGINVWQSTQQAPWNFPVLNGTGVLPLPSSWYFDHNRFDFDSAESPNPYFIPPINIENNGYWAGTWELGWNPYATPDWKFTPLGPMQIDHNEFKFTDSVGAMVWPITIFVSGDKVSILENKFSGSACWAVIADGDWNPETGWLFRGNDFKDFTPWWGRDIWLTPGTTDCTVIGRADTTVLDWGTNNHLIGVTLVP
jgi:hypothetical protein